MFVVNSRIAMYGMWQYRTKYVVLSRQYYRVWMLLKLQKEFLKFALNSLPPVLINNIEKCIWVKEKSWKWFKNDPRKDI
jgi:hypothetical protein